MTGVILAEDMVDVVEEEATEDMYRIASVAGERVMGPLGNSLRRRLPMAVHQPGYRPVGRSDDKFFSNPLSPS